MTANQIDLLANDLASEALGMEKGSIKSTADYVSLAQKLSENKDMFDAVYKTLLDKIGKTAFFSRKYKLQDRHVDVDKMEFGVIYERVRTEWTKTYPNPAWSKEDFDPDNVPSDGVKVQAMYFKALATFATFGVMYNKMLLPSLRSREQFGALASNIFIEMRNCIDYNYAQTKCLAINTMYAAALSMGKPSQRINVLKYHNQMNGTTLKFANCLTDDAFLLTLAELTNNISKALKGVSTLFNCGGWKNQTDEADQIVEVIAPVDSAIKFRLKRTSFHDDMIQLPNYTVVDKWQFAVQDEEYPTLESVSTISVSNDTLTDGDIIPDEKSLKINYTQSGVLVAIRDRAAVLTTIEDFDAASRYNEFSKKNNNMYTADIGYMCDLTQNCVVLYAADEEEEPATPENPDTPTTQAETTNKKSLLDKLTSK